MSFTFNWPRFSDQFHFDAIQMLNTALNKGNKPPIIADRIEVVELEMGTQPPELEIRDIGDLTVDQFRGIFRLTYSGDAHLVLKTKVQANPLNHKQPDIHLVAGSRGMLAAKQPLVVPMLLRLSHFKLNSYVVLVVSKQKGITLVFKTDPLQNVDINSTFDSIAVIQKFIQREIEGQLRQMFREDLPGIIHRLSQQWVKAKVEAPYLRKNPPPPVNVTRQRFGTHSVAGASIRSMPPASIISGAPPSSPSRPQSVISGRSFVYPRRPRSASGNSSASAPKPRSPKPMPPPAPPENVSFPDLENFDPTYGLRPEGLPTKSVFRGFSSLFTPNKGLAELAEDAEDDEELDDDDDGEASFDIVNWDYTVPESNTSIYDDARESVVTESEYETIPAVGGGTITRPRIYHSQSMIQSSLSQGNASPSKHRSPLHSYGTIIPPRSGFTTPGLVSQRSSGMYASYFGGLSSAHSISGGLPTAPPLRSTPGRPVTPDSLETQPSGSSSGRGFSTSTPPTEHPVHDDDGDDYAPHHDPLHHSAIPVRPPPPRPPSTAPSSRRPSVSSTSNLEHPFPSTSPNGLSNLSSSHASSHNPKIVLRNNSIHQLSTLSHSNHTLSPYTRDLQHFTVRSVPPRPAAPSGLASSLERQPVKAKRKRIFHLGGAKHPPNAAEPGTAESKTRPRRTATGGPEFDASDMDRYFRTHEEPEPAPPDKPPTVATTANGVAGQPSPAYQQPLSRRPLHLHHLHNANGNLGPWTTTLPS
ncbi:putative component of the ERMES MDM complex [Lyophyllum shimeji]|uniref:Mitochondrial distribution and morphology protein 34 n=1 Tax=Lyophyllum shimeji TaxID=47721 RepID=A0A9P3PER8_LYOSH|nr:putative component of the ERMES MDM complex [Lyophyllum shimeji]